MMIVQIGANVGGGDAAWDYITKHGAAALLVEPAPAAFAALKATYAGYPSVRFAELAVSDWEGTMPLYTDAHDPVSEVASLYPEHLYQHGKRETSHVDVECVTLDALLARFNLTGTRIDHLLLDAEGMDYRIITSTDFSKYSIDSIAFEHVHTDGPNKTENNYFRIMRHFNKYGYDRYRMTRRDTIVSR